MAEARKRVDWAPVAVGVGVAAMVGVGVYLWLKKPPGVSPGERITAHFKFDYLGEGGIYTIQLRLGSHNRIGGIDWFLAKPGLVWYEDVDLPAPDTYEYDLVCDVPEGAPAATYDAEASIRTPDMSQDDRLIRVFLDNSVTIRKE